MRQRAYEVAHVHTLHVLEFYAGSSLRDEAEPASDRGAALRLASPCLVLSAVAQRHAERAIARRPKRVEPAQCDRNGP